MRPRSIYKSEKLVYEANAFRPLVDEDEETAWMELLELDSDDQAIAVARALSVKHSMRIRLYRAPFVNTTSAHSASLWPDEYKLVADIADFQEPPASLDDDDPRFEDRSPIEKTALSRLRDEFSAFLSDCYQWKWIIALIGVELWRLHVQSEQLTVNRQTLDEMQLLRDVLIDFFDAVVPGPKG